MFRSAPCLVLVAGYPVDSPALPWDMRYPEDSRILHLVARDSAKRRDPSFLTLVCQARPRWSRAMLDVPEPAWSDALVRETGRCVGEWALKSLWRHAHRWPHARLDRSSELAGPLKFDWGEGRRLGLAGDAFSPGGGVQAAWLSGTRLAERLLAEERA
jgi:predicted NAD/FAD-dependent oxidoreductase